MSDLLTQLLSAVSALDPARLALILLTIFGAGVVKGAIGFGFPLVAIPLVSMAWDPRHAVLLAALASLVNNVGIAAGGGGSRQSVRRIVPVLVGMSIGSVGGALLLAVVPSSVLAMVVGSAALVFTTIALLKADLTVPPHLERFLALPMGLMGGLLGGSTGIAGPFVVSYTHALRLSKRDFVYCLTLLYLVGSVVQVVSYTQLGLFDVLTFAVGVASCLPNFLGIWLGFRIQDRINHELFRRIVVVVIGVSGASLVLRGLSS